MKRSQINAAIRAAAARLDEYRIRLPDFGGWDPEDWRRRYADTERVRERMLGWDVTDFGRGDFPRCGAVLFTLRNGDRDDPQLRAPYAEKYIILDDRQQQQIPFHYHISKTEDIINRGGGELVIELFARAADGGADRTRALVVYMDAMRRTVAPGEPVCLQPGQSITIEPLVYHRFYARRGAGMLIAGEVSRVNDDRCDNVFLEESARFCPVEEDEPVLYPLVSEYNDIK